METILQTRRDMTIAMTRGSHGIWLGSFDGGIWHTEPINPDYEDVIFSLGAGDSFIFGIQSALGRGKGFLEALNMGRVCARNTIAHPEAHMKQGIKIGVSTLASLTQQRKPLSGNPVGLL